MEKENGVPSYHYTDLVMGEFPAQRPVTRSFDVFFDLRLNKRLSKQSWGWWFEMLSNPLWRHSNEIYKRNFGYCHKQRCWKVGVDEVTTGEGKCHSDAGCVLTSPRFNATGNALRTTRGHLHNIRELWFTRFIRNDVVLVKDQRWPCMDWCSVFKSTVISIQYIKYTMILHTSLQKVRQNINQCEPTTTGKLGGVFCEDLEKIDGVITVSHFYRHSL